MIIHPTSQTSPAAKHVVVAVVRIATTRVRKNEQPWASQNFAARSAFDCLRYATGGEFRPEPSKNGDPEEADGLRTVTHHLLGEKPTPFLEVDPVEFRAPTRRPRDDTGQTDTVLGQTQVILVGHEPRDQFRLVQQPPELVSTAGKVMAKLIGSLPWIDPDQQDVEAVGKVVR